MDDHNARDLDRLAIHVTDHYAAMQQLLMGEAAKSSIAAIISQARRTLQNGGKLLFCGNGGSFSMAQHLAGECVGRYAKDGPPLAAIALGSSGAEMTCIANDLDYREVFARPLRALGRPGDLLIAMSTSGTSPSITHAVAVAEEQGIAWSLWTCERAPEMRAHVDRPYEILRAPTTDTGVAQVIHLIVGHYICARLEEDLR